MSSETPAPMSEKPASQLKAFFGNPLLVPLINYLLLFLLVVSAGMSGVLAITLAYLFRDDAPEWLKNHYAFQVRTFWIAIAIYIPVMVLLLSPMMTNMIVGGGVIVVFFGLFLWIVSRCVMGFNHLVHNRPYPTPKGWLI
jgi:uncharacterized membrane protein